jgi:hypothetical protein
MAAVAIQDVVLLVVVMAEYLIQLMPVQVLQTLEVVAVAQDQVVLPLPALVGQVGQGIA